MPSYYYELIEMLFGMWTWVGPRNCVLDGVSISLEGKRHFLVGWC